MKRLESRACLEDNVGYLASSLRLVEDTALMDMLLPREPGNLPANGKLGGLDRDSRQAPCG